MGISVFVLTALRYSVKSSFNRRLDGKNFNCFVSNSSPTYIETCAGYLGFFGIQMRATENKFLQTDASIDINRYMQTAEGLLGFFYDIAFNDTNTQTHVINHF